MVFEHLSDHDSPWAAMESIASKIGCTAETLGRHGGRRHKRVAVYDTRALKELFETDDEEQAGVSTAWCYAL